MRPRHATPIDFTMPAAANRGVDHTAVVYRQRPGRHGTGLIYTRGGGAWFRAAGQHCTCGPRDLVLLHSSSVIEYGPLPPRHYWATYWTHFDLRPQWASWLNWPQEIPGVRRIGLARIDLRREVLGAFVQLCKVVRSNQPFKVEFVRNALERLLLTCRVASPRQAEDLLDERVVRMTQYMEEHLGRRIMLGDLARIACLSPSYCGELFKAQLGMTPVIYLERLRLAQAQMLLLRTTKPIRQIAVEVGLPDPAYLSRRFRLVYGQSPRQLRQHYEK